MLSPSAASPGADEDEPRPAPDPYDPTSFESRIVNGAALPLVAGAAILVQQSPLGFLLEGFHVWIHELGHASIAWLTGRKALPLPIGWTNVEQDRSIFVYAAVLALLAILAVAGWRQQKMLPIILAAALAVLQAYMTWFLPDDRGRMWMIFGGVGGEFYIAAAMIGFFYFEFPDKFRWGTCRYVFLFIGSASFFETYAFWRRVKRGLEGIPYGSMINGEDDGGGDMDILKNDYGWTQHHIIATYNHLATACLAALILLYAFFTLRLDRRLYRLVDRIW